MKSRTLTCITAMTLLAALATPARLSAQEQKKGHPHYKLVDLGTLGGPVSYGSVNGFGNQILNNAGIVSSSADTATRDPNAPNFCFNPDCFLTHAFRWKDGVMTDLGALPGLNNSAAGSLNARGWSVGQSQNGEIDPLTGSPELRAVLWKHGEIIDLGTLGGNEAVGVDVNNRGQVVGFATNAIPDPFSGFGTQVRTFLWENGVMQDLGTLGGPDSPPAPPDGNIIINERGQVAGSSFTNSTPNTVTGLPTTDPFLWEKGTMTDLGTLGGTLGFPVFLNNRGQVVGQSNLAGDLTAHPFLSHRGMMRDLGTLGGTFGRATWINDAGEIVGGATNQNDQAFLAFLWKDGVMTNLGSVDGDPCSDANSINAKGQVVGSSATCDFFTVQHAFLWDDGQMIDLNTLVPHNSSLQLLAGFNINDRGEIVGVGVPPGAPLIPDLFGHLFLLIPCDGDHADAEGCNDDTESSTAVSQNNPAPATQTSTNLSQGRLTPETLADLRARFAHRHRGFGFGVPRF